MLLKHLVRLACIRHAASVHPEPGSNSPPKSHSCECKSYTEIYWIDKVVLLPITSQLLRCRLKAGGYYPLLLRLSSPSKQTKIPMPLSASACQTAKPQTACVSDWRRFTKFSTICRGGRDLFEFHWPNDDYTLFNGFVNRFLSILP